MTKTASVSQEERRLKTRTASATLSSIRRSRPDDSLHLPTAAAGHTVLMTATRRNASSRRRCSPLAPRWRAGSSNSAAAWASSSSALSFAARAEARVGRSLLRRVCVTVVVLVAVLVVVGWGAWGGWAA